MLWHIVFDTLIIQNQKLTVFKNSMNKALLLNLMCFVCSFMGHATVLDYKELL